MRLNFLLLIFALAVSHVLAAQNQETFGKFIIQDARFNNSDISETAIDIGEFLVF